MTTVDRFPVPAKSFDGDSEPVTTGKAIRLFLFTDSFIHGGTERQFVQTLRALDSARYEITVCCLKKEGPFLADVESLGFRILQFRIRSLYGAETGKEQERLTNLLRKEKVQIVHTFDFYTNIFAVPAARRAGVPVVLASRRETSSHRSWAKRMALRWACQKATGVVTNSRAAALALPGFFPGWREKITVVPNGIDLERFSPSAPVAHLREELGARPETLLVGTVAALRLEKQLDLFVKAAAIASRRCPEARFLLAGEGPERGRMEKLITELGVSDSVRLLGDRRDIPNFLSALDVFVHSSSTESFPNAVLEAMTMGKPVVATNVGGIPEVVEEGVTGFLVADGAPEEMAAQIEILLRDAEKRKQMGVAGRRRVEANYTRERLAQKLDALYARELRRSQPVARVMQISNFPPPMDGWAIHVVGMHKAMSASGIDARVMDIGPGRRIPFRDCVSVNGMPDFLAKVTRYAFQGFLFEPHVNGDSWKGYLLALFPLLLGRMTGRRGVLMFHAGPAQMYFPRSRGFWRFAFWLLFRASGAIICNLESVKAEIVKYGVLPDKVHPIFSVAYEPEELPVPLSEKVEAFLQSHEPRLFSYTLFRPEFTRECLFQAFAGILKHYPNAGLLIAGPREVPDEVRAEMKKWGVEDRIHVAGNMDHAQFLTAIQRSVVSIRTHLRDGLCASVLEALELGVPVVAAEDGQRPASVITYAPADAADLQAKLLEVLANPSAARAKVIRPQLHKGLDEEISVLLRAAGVKHGIPKRVAT